VWGVLGRAKRSGFPTLPWGRSLLIGQDNRFSTSRTTAVIWTYTVAVAVASFVISKWLGYPGALDRFTKQGLQGQYALLVGGPLGAAILAKGIVSAQLASGDSAKPAAESASPGQLAQDDAGNADLGDIQYLLFNAVALLFFYGDFMGTPQGGLPSLPDALVGLTSLSAVGYVSKKTLSSPAIVSDVAPREATVGSIVRLVTSGLVKSGDDLSVVKVEFGQVPAPVRDITETTSQGVLLDLAVPDAAAGVVAIAVALPSGKSTSWPSFKVVPKILEVDPHWRVATGEEIRLKTSGVSGMAPRLLGVTVTIAGKAVKPTLDAEDSSNSTLKVTVPPAGELKFAEGALELLTKIYVSTPGGSSQPAPITVVAAA
jgi:hypothetical protein